MKRIRADYRKNHGESNITDEELAEKFGKNMIRTSQEIKADLEKTMGIGFWVDLPKDDPRKESKVRVKTTTTASRELSRLFSRFGTKTGVAYTFNFVEYSNLISSDEFIEFILKFMNINKVTSSEIDEKTDDEITKSKKNKTAQAKSKEILQNLLLNNQQSKARDNMQSLKHDLQHKATRSVDAAYHQGYNDALNQITQLSSDKFEVFKQRRKFQHEFNEFQKGHPDQKQLSEYLTEHSDMIDQLNPFNEADADVEAFIQEGYDLRYSNGALDLFK